MTVTELPLRYWLAVWWSLALTQPSSAMIERAFSQLRATISDNQHLALGDVTEASLLLKYNNRNQPSSRLCYDVVENLSANMQQTGNVRRLDRCVAQ